MQLVDMWVAHSLEVQILYSTMNIKGLAMNYKETYHAIIITMNTIAMK